MFPLRRWLGLFLAFIALAACGEQQETAVVEPSPQADHERSGAVVLMYHRFGEDQYPSTNIRLSQFEQHLDYLAREDYRVWPLERVVQYLQAGRAFPDRVVAITIDDAYRSVYEEAFPRLRERGWPYTVFANSDAHDQRSGDYMTWEQMRRMAETGATFANHSATHDFLVTRKEEESESRWRARVREDIEQAERRLREELGEAVPDQPALFAYPYGEYDEALRQLVKELGFVAFGQHSGPVGHYSDLLALPRFAMAEAYGDMADFRQRVRSRPFPTLEVEPRDPTAVDRENPPLLRLRFDETAANLDQFNCFAGRHGTRIAWLDRERREVEVRAEGSMPAGRSRYNCTAPGPDGRFFWFSQLWLKDRR